MLEQCYHDFAKTLIRRIAITLAILLIGGNSMLLVAQPYRHKKLLTFQKHYEVRYGQEATIAGKIIWYKLTDKYSGKQFGFKMVHTDSMEEVVFFSKYSSSTDRYLYWYCEDDITIGFAIDYKNEDITVLVVLGDGEELKMAFQRKDLTN